MYSAEELPDASGYLAKHQPRLIWVRWYCRSTTKYYSAEACLEHLLI